MLEKAVIAVGGLLGITAGIAFYYAAEHLRLPALLFAIVDLFGVTAGSIAFGLFSAPVAMGTLVLLIDRFFPGEKGSQDS